MRNKKETKIEVNTTIDNVSKPKQNKKSFISKALHFFGFGKKINDKEYVAKDIQGDEKSLYIKSNPNKDTKTNNKSNSKNKDSSQHTRAVVHIKENNNCSKSNINKNKKDKKGNPKSSNYYTKDTQYNKTYNDDIIIYIDNDSENHCNKKHITCDDNYLVVNQIDVCDHKHNTDYGHSTHHHSHATHDHGTSSYNDHSSYIYSAHNTGNSYSYSGGDSGGCGGGGSSWD